MTNLRRNNWITRGEWWISICGIVLVFALMSAWLVIGFQPKEPDDEVYVFPFGTYYCDKSPDINGIFTQTCVKQVSNGTINKSAPSTTKSPTNIQIEVKS